MLIERVPVEPEGVEELAVLELVVEMERDDDVLDIEETMGISM